MAGDQRLSRLWPKSQVTLLGTADFGNQLAAMDGSATSGWKPRYLVFRP